MVKEAREQKNLAAALHSMKEADPKDLLTVAVSLAQLARAALRAL